MSTEQINLKSRWLITFGVSIVLIASFLTQGVRLGQDLKGGTTLRFSLDLELAEKTHRIETGKRDKIVEETLKVIDQRINKYGLAETTVQPIGDRKFEISLPADSEVDTDDIIDLVTALGDLKFRVTVRPRDGYRGRDDNSGIPRLAQPGDAPWAGAEGFPATSEGYRAFLEAEVEKFKVARDTDTPYFPTDPRYFVVPKQERETDEATDYVLLEEPSEDKYKFDGRILVNPVVSRGDAGRPVVLYNVKTEFQNVFGEWTGRNIGLPMAIILNEEYYSDPVIQSKLTDNVQITLGSGRAFSEVLKEAEQIATVLQTGSLKVRPQLESREKIGARLAGKSRERGILAVIVAFILVLAFMLFFYRGSGIVANLALLLNVALLIGTLSFFRAVLSLPGIAGIVLTLGMAVDANILINERIREELLAGRSIRRAVTEGYNRAFRTIVDANVTSLITAIFLYVFGSGAVRGFAVTLAVGLVVSMFTSIYVTRTVFEWLMKHGKIKSWSMVGTGLPPKISWVALRRFFAPISVIGVVFGLLVFALEDKYTFYDVDFTGGLKITAGFDKPTTVDEVRAALSSESRTLDIDVEEYDENKNLVRTRHQVQAGPYDRSSVVAVGGAGEGVEITVQRGIQEPDKVTGKIPSIGVQEKAFATFVRMVLEDRLLPDWIAKGPVAYTAPEDAADEMKAVDGGLHLRVNLLDSAQVLTPARLDTAIKNSMPFYRPRSEQRLAPASSVERALVIKPVESQGKHHTFDIWMKSKQGDRDVEQNVKNVRSTFKTFLGGKGLREALIAQGVDGGQAMDVGLCQPFSSVDTIGASWAQRLQNDAMIALVLSLLGIIVYIALRFSSRAMGLAAVICLFHDVAITLGIVALANIFGLVDAKISLPMVAAFLTLVGYSVNDTVVVFDRIRENRGKKRVITPAMIDLSINQTLARTIKTSATFLLAAVALFVINFGQRNVLEGFSFILIVGSLIGTYSTVAIASPLLLFLPWLWERVKTLRPRASLVTVPAAKWYLLLLVPVAAVLWFVWGVAFLIYAFFAGLVLFPIWALTVPVKAVQTDEPVPVPAGS